MIRFTLYFLCIALIFPLVGQAEEATIRIGWIGPLTGNSAVLGIDSVVAAQMAVDEANSSGIFANRRVELVAEDDQHDTAKTVSSYVKLVTKDKVSAILISTYGGYFAASPRAVRDNVILINPLDCNNDIAKLPSNSFCLATETESIGNIIAEHIHEMSNVPIALLYDQTHPFMLVVHKTIEKRLTELGNTVPISSGYSPDTVDFKPHLLRVRAKKPKALVLLGHDPMGQAMREARNLGFASQFYTVGTITSPGFQKIAGEAANGTLVAFWKAPKSKKYEEFIRKFKKRVNRPPILELATIPSYDSSVLLLEAIAKVVGENGGVDVEQVKGKLLEIRDYEAISGKVTMESDGVVRSIKESLYTFEDGVLTLHNNLELSRSSVQKTTHP